MRAGTTRGVSSYGGGAPPEEVEASARGKPIRLKSPPAAGHPARSCRTNTLAPLLQTTLHKTAQARSRKSFQCSISLLQPSDPKIFKAIVLPELSATSIEKRLPAGCECRHAGTAAFHD